MFTGPIDIARVHRSHEWLKREHTMLEFSEAETAGETGVQYVHARPKFQPRSGALQDATKAEVRVIRNNGHLIRLFNRKKYAAAIDLGARPHIIRAKHGFLRFRGRGGTWVFARQVRHPGNKPYQFLHDAAWVAGRSFYTRMGAGMAKLARRF